MADEITALISSIGITPDRNVALTKPDARTPGVGNHVCLRMFYEGLDHGSQPCPAGHG